jgi:Zn-dependent protease with chaperone function
LVFILQFRFGWVAMWLGIVIASTWAQYNMDALAPSMLGLKNPMPAEMFAVGRGFPLVNTHQEYQPWISLNRIYFKDMSASSPRYVTKDLSAGQLNLTGENGKWAIESRHPVFAQTPYAKLTAGSLGEDGDKWTGGEAHGKWDESSIGLRSGGKLRDEVFGFARENDVDVSEVYFLDGSHQDARSNAFVAGAGKKKVIGLYDTLFLGEHQEDDVESPDKPRNAPDQFLLSRITKKIQELDLSEETPKPVWHNAKTEAMTDAEILAILAHELGHSAYGHIEKGMVVQAVTSFITFAVMGFMVSDPLVAVAFGMAAPVTHVGLFAYDYVVGPPLDGGIKLFTDANTRNGEYEADAYTAEVSEKLAIGLQTALVKLTINSNQDPDEPWYYEWLHADHPTTAKRWAYIEEVKKEVYGDKKGK